ncbi:hypothetical protein [Rhodopila sp.]|uniref:hypothetical protein n=1 Tax=Rhodopila sp. TaxID=2480087 RepID=UPI003D11E310
MDSLSSFGHSPAMRIFYIMCLIVLSSCSGDPRSLGITGPGTQAATPPPSSTLEDTTGTPGVPTSGSFYGPSRGPVTGASGFWGYN